MNREEFEKLSIPEQNSVLFDLLQEILKKIEPVNKPFNNPLPYNPPVVDPTIQKPWIGGNKCGVCGIDFSGMTGYICSRIDCPTGKITFS